MPSSAICSSSRQLSAKMRPRRKGSMQTYASAKRRVMIAAGERPSSSSSLELMKVVPQTAAVSAAVM